MNINKIRVDNKGNGAETVLTDVEFYAQRSGLGDRSCRQIRLAAEELMELVKNISGTFEADFSAEITNRRCELSLVTDTVSDPAKKAQLIQAGQFKTGVADKLRRFLQSDYKNLKEQEDILDDLGIKKADAALLEEIGHSSFEDAYVWTLGSYGMKAYDSHVLDDDAGWAEIGQSILANLADDIRVFVFDDRVEITVIKLLDEEPLKREYDISPEFKDLKKVPIPISRFQVRAVQVLYKRHTHRPPVQKGISVIKTRIPADSSREGSIHSLVYSSSDIAENEDVPCVLLIHGGAFLLPALPYHYRLANRIAKEIRCRVVMPMYDLAPDDVPPFQQDELFEVYKHLIDHPTWYHIIADKIALIGDSAGGTLCASTSMMARDNGTIMPVCQALLYPFLDKRLKSDSMQIYQDVPVCNAKSIMEYQKLCRADEFTGDPRYVSPVEAKSFEGLCDTYIETAEFDALHDDGILYARLLNKAGCWVELNETKGTVHAFDMAKDSKILAAAMEKRIAFLKNHF